MPMDLLNFLLIGQVWGVRFEESGAIFSSPNKNSFLTPGSITGIFENLHLSELDILVIKQAYEERKTIGTPDGMSKRPDNISERKWKMLLKYAKITTIQDNYFLSAAALKSVYKEIAEDFINRWKDFFQKDSQKFIAVMTAIENHLELMEHLLKNIENINAKFKEIYAVIHSFSTKKNESDKKRSLNSF